MLSPIANLPSVEAELPKFPLNSSRDDAFMVQAKDYSSSRQESLHLKYKNRDGDTLELKSFSQEEVFFRQESREITAGYSRTAARGAKENAGPEEAEANATDAEAEEIDTEKQAWAEMQAWVGRMKEELKQQQLELLKVLLNQKEKQGDSDPAKPHVIPVAGNFLEDGAEAVVQPEVDVAPIPEYWNAENTSNRIVQMATGFAKISGLDPHDFAEIITAAVEEGFSSAHEVTGDLPGAAGKLNQDTHALIQSKLKKWLDDWEATVYNQKT